MRLPTDPDVTAHVGVVFVLLEEVVSTDEDFAQPLENFCIVEDLVLDELLGDGK